MKREEARGRKRNGLTMEGDGGENKGENHSRGAEEHRASSADRIHYSKGDTSEKEIDGSDDETGSGGVVEADRLEERCGLKDVTEEVRRSASGERGRDKRRYI